MAGNKRRVCMKSKRLDGASGGENAGQEGPAISVYPQVVLASSIVDTSPLLVC